MKFPAGNHRQVGKASLPVRGAWIEMRMDKNGCIPVASLPVRGAWIEISASPSGISKRKVAPRAGSVD